MNLRARVCLLLWLDNILTAADIFPSVLPGHRLLLESDCTTHPLLSNERIRLYIFAAIPCWGYPFLSLFLSPPPPPRQGTLLHLWVSVVSLQLECILDCWHMKGASIHVHKTPPNPPTVSKHQQTPVHVGTEVNVYTYTRLRGFF